MRPAATPAQSTKKPWSASRIPRNPSIGRPKRLPFSATVNNNNNDEDKNTLLVPSHLTDSSSFQVPQTPHGKFKLPFACSTQLTKKRRTSPNDTSDNSSFEEGATDKLFKSKYLQHLMMESFAEEEKTQKRLIFLSDLSSKRENADPKFYANIAVDVHAVSKATNDLDKSEHNLAKFLKEVDFLVDSLADPLKKRCDVLPLKNISLNNGAKNREKCICDNNNKMLLNGVAAMESTIVKMNAGCPAENAHAVVDKYKECRDKMNICNKAIKKLNKDLEIVDGVALQATSINLYSQ